jgi:hypothetical protein
MERGSFIELASFERLPRARDKIAGHVYAELSRKRAFVPERVQAPSLLCGPAQKAALTRGAAALTNPYYRHWVIGSREQ